MKQLEELVIMGGAITVPGNTTSVAEFNMFVDPEAAAIVFSFPIHKTLVPLDACNKVCMSLDDFQRIKNSPLKTALLQMSKPYISNLVKDTGIKAAIMYDPLTLYYLINPKAAKTYHCTIAIETKGELTRGMTVAGLRSASAAQPNTTVVEYINRDMFINDFIQILSNE